MLTISDVNGEAGFLYFKNAELIEANYAALWGTEALSQVAFWELAEHNVAPLPLGIKRSLWEPLETLLNPTPVPTLGRNTETLHRATKKFSALVAPRQAQKSTFDRYKTIPGLQRIITIHAGKAALVFDAAPRNDGVDDISWFSRYVEGVSITGDSLGFGMPSRWSLDTDKYQIVGLRQDDMFLIILRKNESGHEDLELDLDIAITGTSNPWTSAS